MDKISCMNNKSSTIFSLNSFVFSMNSFLSKFFKLIINKIFDFIRLIKIIKIAILGISDKYSIKGE